MRVARTGWSKQGGFEIYLDDPSLGLDLWDALWAAGADLDVRAGCPNGIERIEGGLLSYGGDMDRSYNPYECGFDAFCQLDRPTEFLARSALEPIAADGPTRRIVGVAIDTDELPPCATGWPVLVGSDRVGTVTSAAFSPDRGGGVAIATLDRGYWEPGTEVCVETTDGERPGVVSPLPFAPVDGS